MAVALQNLPHQTFQGRDRSKTGYASPLLTTRHLLRLQQNHDKHERKKYDAL